MSSFLTSSGDLLGAQLVDLFLLRQPRHHLQHHLQHHQVIALEVLWTTALTCVQLTYSQHALNPASVDVQVCSFELLLTLCLLFSLALDLPFGF